MRKLKIVGCTDPMMWYAGLVGQVVPLVREESDIYLSREPAGFSNIVRKRDAKPVWVDREGREFGDGDAVDCACKQAVLVLSKGVSNCQPIGPVPLGSTHSVARCTFDPSAIGTKVQMPRIEISAPPRSAAAVAQAARSALERAIALLRVASK